MEVYGNVWVCCNHGLQQHQNDVTVVTSCGASSRVADLGYLVSHNDPVHQVAYLDHPEDDFDKTAEK